MEKLFVIKIGGEVLDHPEKLNIFLKDFASIKEKKILIHGGGKIATKIGDRLGIKSNYIDGRRITDGETINLVTMVYGGLINKNIVAQLQQYACNALGICGADGNLIKATKRKITNIDYGFVGDISAKDVNSKLLELLVNEKITPVIAPLAQSNGELLNINADTIASVLAISASKHYQTRLIFCFDKKGVLNDIENSSSVISHLNKSFYKNLLTDGKIQNGIIPKLDNAFNALDAGVKEIIIGEASDLLQNVTRQNSGTLITL